MENNYQYDTMKLLEKCEALRHLSEINVCKHIVIVIIACSIHALCHNIVISVFQSGNRLTSIIVNGP